MRLRLATAALLLSCAASAQDAGRGAMLYMRLPDGTRACLSCHGPDPGANPNNILRGATNPAAVTKALSTVSAMGFLSSKLDDTDRADLAAFLGTVSSLSATGAWPRAFPVTLESGTAGVGQPAATQVIRLRNESAQSVPVGAVSIEGHAVEVTHDCPTTLPAGAACEVRTVMRPVAAGWQRSALRIVLPGAPAALYAGASVLGTAEPASTLRLEQGATAIDFAGAASPEVRRTVTLDNPGPMPARIDALFLLGPGAPRFRIESGCAPGTVLQSGTQCQMQVAYTPQQTAGEAFLRVRSDQGHPQALLLRGATAQAPAPEPPAPVPPPVMSDGGGGGGGCSMRDVRSSADPTLLAALLLALGWRLRRPGRKRA